MARKHREERTGLSTLTAISPQPRYTLEYEGCPASCRLIDIFCPIGHGQRGLIVSPPKAGKTTLLQDIARALLHNHEDVQVVAMLIDERPEEVTDFRRSLGEEDEDRYEVAASSNDRGVENHIRVATETIDRCREMAFEGGHVVVLLDSLTRVGRAFNRSPQHGGKGRTLSGGIGANALEVPKQIFGSARNTEEAGSLAVIATCLVDTGSRGDQVIFEEFKGTGNMELVLDRKVAERRVFPAMNLAESGTRKEHLLMNEDELEVVGALRRTLLRMPPVEQMQELLDLLEKYPTNDELVQHVVRESG